MIFGQVMKRLTVWRGHLLAVAFTEWAKEATVLAGVAGPFAFLYHLKQKGVSITVIECFLDVLTITRGFTLAPILLSTSTPKPSTASR